MSNLSEPLVTEPVQQDLSGSEQQLEPFYTTLLSLKFTESATAIKQCRALCAQYGFTVKQEASTHRNIYVYCSREGLPDSLRNPKSNPQRKRPSKRCDCRWRVVLYEREGKWEFRKSLNPEAAKHNHELMRPEEIETSWPKEVIGLICELARQRLPTQEIRSRVKSQFKTITWNERRFYNRLSDERQKIRYREAGQRARHLTGIWTKICMVSAGHEDLADFVQDDLKKLLDTVCRSTNTEESTLIIPSPLSPSPTLLDNDLTTTATATTKSQVDVPYSTCRQNTNLFTGFVDQSPGTTQSQLSRNASLSKGKAPETSDKITTTTTTTTTNKSEPPKGYINVDIPQHSFMVKIHTRTGSITQASIPQLSIGDNTDSMIRNPRRTRSTSTDITDSTTRKTPRRGKSKQSLASSSSSSPSLSPTSASAPMGLDSVLGTSLHRLQQQHHHHHHDHQGMMSHHHQQQQQQRSSHPLSTIADESLMHPPSDTGGSFVYPHFDTQGGIPLDTTSLSPYVPFQNTYSISTSSNGFTSDMSFQFDPPSPTPMGGSNNNESGRNNNDNVSHSNEPTIHPALQSNPMAHHERSTNHHHQNHQQQQHHHHHIQHSQQSQHPPPQLRKIQPLHHQITSTAPSGMTIDAPSPSRPPLYSIHMRPPHSPTGPFTPSYSPTTPTTQNQSPFLANHPPPPTDHVLNHAPTTTSQEHHLQELPRRVSSSSLGN